MKPAELLSSSAVRARCRLVYEDAQANKLLHFSISEAGLERAISEVAAIIRTRFPSLEVPATSRWLHISSDRRQKLKAALAHMSALEQAKCNFDFIIISVLTDAGAGADWCYKDGNDRRYSRSEGLAQAGFDSFITGFFSSVNEQPIRVDAAALKALSAQSIAKLFQVNAENPMTGLDGRAGLLNRLGAALCDRFPSRDPSELRPAHLLEAILERVQQNTIEAAEVLKCVLNMLGPIWPGRILLEGVNLGDTWVYPPYRGDALGGLIPFHKLSQWLSYSLFEPLSQYGISVTNIDRLTALAEYRNGGLLLDSGAIVPHDSSALSRTHKVDDSFVIEWRALTVALVDILADRLRTTLKLTAAQLPLASVIEGGTWAAGREIAARLRPGGSSPIRIESDGTVF